MSLVEQQLKGRGAGGSNTRQACVWQDPAVSHCDLGSPMFAHLEEGDTASWVMGCVGGGRLSECASSHGCPGMLGPEILRVVACEAGHPGTLGPFLGPGDRSGLLGAVTPPARRHPRWQVQVLPLETRPSLTEHYQPLQLPLLPLLPLPLQLRETAGVCSSSKPQSLCAPPSSSASRTRSDSPTRGSLTLQGQDPHLQRPRSPARAQPGRSLHCGPRPSVRPQYPESTWCTFFPRAPSTGRPDLQRRPADLSG